MLTLCPASGLSYNSQNESVPTSISAAASRVSAWVVPTNEELMIARHTRSLLATTKEAVS